MLAGACSKSLTLHGDVRITLEGGWTANPKHFRLFQSDNR
jgi:hypothetical protein